LCDPLVMKDLLAICLSLSCCNECVANSSLPLKTHTHTRNKTNCCTVLYVSKQTCKIQNIHYSSIAPCPPLEVGTAVRESSVTKTVPSLLHTQLLLLLVLSCVTILQQQSQNTGVCSVARSNQTNNQSYHQPLLVLFLQDETTSG
jgi:hypothetical protein